ncbi:MAG: methyltransferase domain-containing protein [Actinomycetota bacterium]|nr:methyltransferase domain-containing protein [Actinomycetota bacterium]
MQICTIIARNYLAYARALATSFQSYHPDGTCSVLVIDDVDETLDDSTEPFAIVRPDELGLNRFEAMAAMYDVTELSTALKPWFLRLLLERTGGGPVSYFDPDIRFYAPIGHIDALAREHSLVLIPHVIDALPRDGKQPSEIDILASGTYNLGFIALTETSQTDWILDWWCERLRYDCVIDHALGLFVDQRWFDLVPTMASDVHILRDPDVNVAYWNLHARTLEAVDGHSGGYTINGMPLKFFHFSGFDPDRPHLLSKHQSRIRLSEAPVLAQLCRDYSAELKSFDHERTKRYPYPYSMLSEGIELHRVLRALYREGERDGCFRESPFTPQGTAEFFDWLNSPVPEVAQNITRFWHSIYTQRPDRQAAFPDLAATDADGYVEWIREFGVHEHGFVRDVGRLKLATTDAVPETHPLPRQHFEPPPGVNVAGYLRSELGIGEAARGVISALDAQRVPVMPVHGRDIASYNRQGHAFRSAPSEAAHFPINLICVNADSVARFAKDVGPDFFANRYSIGYWWWEVSDFPALWMDSFRYVDEVWAGSRHAVDAIESVSPVPVIHASIPVAPVETAPLPRAALGLPDSFMFLFVFDYNSVFERKNPLAVVEAFRSAFPPGSGASLLLKSINQESDPDNHDRLRLAAEEHPDVYVVDRYLAPAQKDALITSCDCYVSLHRAEGFGFPLAEAMYFGKPVIATGYSGNLDFMSESNSYLVDYQHDLIGPGNEPYPAGGRWADPDLEQAATYMRRVFERRGEARERGLRAARDIRRTHSPQAIGKKLELRLRWIRANRLGSVAPSPSAAARELVGVETLIEHGLGSPPRSPLGPLGPLARRLVLRLMKPFTAYQRVVDDRLVHATKEALTRLEQQMAEKEEQMQANMAEMFAELRRQTAELHGQASRTRRLIEETQAAPYVAGEPYEVFDDPVVGTVIGYTDGDATPRGPDAYVAFEDVFRGPEGFIRARQRPYIELIGDREPVVDAGCGRGEFLDLLLERDLDHVGVDVDPGMVERCATRGHTAVVLSHLNDYLAAQDDSSIGVIFSAELIEHLTYDDLVRFFELSLAKLKPGGRFIAETVNPHSISALKTFWVDLTHRHPIFPEAALTLCRLAGFHSAFAFYPNGGGDLEQDRVRTGEYAVVATKVSARG